MTRASRTTLQPLLDELLRRAQEARARELREEEEHFRAAYEWWSGQDLQVALERRNEDA